MDGLEAFEMVQRDEFDYIVMDVNMPRMAATPLPA